MRTAAQTVAARVARGGAPTFTERRGEGWVVFVDGTPTAAEAFAHSVAHGMSDHPRWLHCRYLYDPAGSRLFSRITEQPEYYLTRVETRILEDHASDIRARVGNVPLVELGAGTAIKTHLLLKAWTAGGDPVEYIPIDIDASILCAAAARVTEEVGSVSVTGLGTSYDRGLDLITGHSPLCLVFLGSTLGNFNPRETDRFLARLRDCLSPRDAFLLGVDLVKDPAILEAAYNDAAGVSEAFTRNLFVRMNRELDAGVPVTAIDHVAYWNDRLERIEIYARFGEAAGIDLSAIGRRFRVAAGEMVLTEISRKFRVEAIEADLARFSFRLEEVYTDVEQRFALLLSRRIEGAAGPPRWAALAAELQAVRRRTLDLIDPLTDHQLAVQVLPHLSPIAWDLGHMAEFEEHWLVRIVDALASGSDADPPGLESMYDASRTPRAERGSLALPSREELLRRLRQVREEALDRLRGAGATVDHHPLLRGGFLYHLLAQHEAQHQETILQALALMGDLIYEPAWREATPRPSLPPDVDMVLVSAGPFAAGTSTSAHAYDNERPLHWIELPDYWIDTAPVTNGDFLGFMGRGGYTRREWWSDEGWTWRRESGVTAPLGWRRQGGGWEDVQFGHVEPLVLNRPVQHVSWYEADAFARSVGKRLPTEMEWEKAAAWDPERRVPRPYPWGDDPPDPRLANLDARLYVPAPVGAYPQGRSFYGCHQMLGDVWEWTSSLFAPYPGFEPFPYPEYSAAHFDRGHRVLRGASWSTAALVARNTFRNWDLPERRQIFAGFRCARDG